MEAKEFEDAIATTNLLPGPASTQLAIFCAWRLRRSAGALLGGVCFILPGLVLILGLVGGLLGQPPARLVLGAAAGAGAAVPAVALSAAWRLVPASRGRMGEAVSAGSLGPLRPRWGSRRSHRRRLPGSRHSRLWPGRDRHPPAGATVVRGRPEHSFPLVLLSTGRAVGGLGALVWVAFKVGALSYGGGFVIVPLMQHDVVVTYHWMTGAQFLNAVALGQITPGPVVQTMAVVGYAAGGLGGGLLAALIVFAPSFVFVLVGAPHFDQIRANNSVESFLTGAGPAVIGAIAGSAIPLGLAFQHLWQIPVLAGAVVWLFAARRGVVSGLLLAGAVGILVALSGVPA